MTTTTGLTTHSLDVPGARLHYEVRGRGPLILILGAPMAAAEFAPLAHALASDHTVVTTDPRGIGASVLDDPESDSTPELRADDAVAILDDLGADSADVFGSSGGAITGLALVTRYPNRVGTLIAHEPPVMELLPDAEQQRAATEEIVDAYRTGGMFAGYAKFMAFAGFDMPDAPPGAAPEPSAQDLSDAAHFFEHELRGTAGYRPDIAALTSGQARVVLGLGADSAHLVTQRTTMALAEQMGVTPVLFVGDHGGFIGAPGEFAETVRAVLAG
jgi:pimeloyl-ACP methyl ester carboxylesterase